MRRRRKQKNKSIIRLTALLIFLFIAIRAFKITLSRYESMVDGSAKVEIARFLINTDYQNMTLNLDSITAGAIYEYDFSVANYDDDIVTDAIISYDLKVRATTNLPLQYELFMNDNQAISAITNNEVIEDDFGTYFRVLTTVKQEFGFEEKEINRYKLKVTVPSTCSSIEYQDIIEAIEISVKAEQVTEQVEDTEENDGGN